MVVAKRPEVAAVAAAPLAKVQVGAKIAAKFDVTKKPAVAAPKVA